MAAADAGTTGAAGTGRDCVQNGAAELASVAALRAALAGR